MQRLKVDSLSVGDRLRERRKEHGIGVRELSRRIGVSAGLVSQIERGLVSPSVGTLYAMVQELELSLDELFNRSDEVTPADGQPSAGAGGALVGPDSPAGPHVVRAGQGKTVQLGDGVQWELLTPTADPAIDFLHATYDVGGLSSSSHVAMRHAGYEYGRVIVGTLRVTVGFETFDLEPGDSISFDSTIPHLLENVGAEPVHVVWFVIGRHGDSRLSG